MFEDKLIAAKLRLTKHRMKNIDYLCQEADGGVTVDFLYLLLIANNESITLSTLYRIIRELERAGIVRQIELDEKKNCYELIAA